MTRAKQTWQGLLRCHLQSAKRPLVVVLGPTASGKTDFSLEVARAIGDAEIVNADSRQLYRGLDVGTAKIRPEEMQGVKHHLIDVLDPSEEVTIGWYQERARSVIHAIHARMAVPILVGGSMLYLSTIIDGLKPLPAVDPGLRRKLEEEYDRDGGVGAYRRLQELDSESALAIHRNNKVYVVRALEIIEATGKRASTQKHTAPSPYDLLIFGLRWPREKLVERINQRTQMLLQQGWIEEVRRLLERGFDEQSPAMKSHGYREIASLLRSLEHIDVTELTEVITANTRRYAKRQVTWWRRDPRIHWIDVS